MARASGKTKMVLTLIVTQAPAEYRHEDVTRAVKTTLSGTPGLHVESVEVMDNPDRAKDPAAWLRNLADQLHEMLRKTDL